MIILTHDIHHKTAEIKTFLKENTSVILRSLGVQEQNGRYFCPICQSNPEQHRTPDMTVRGAVCKCWKCGMKDDVIGLYMKTRNVGFMRALEELHGSKITASEIKEKKTTPAPKKRIYYASSIEAIKSSCYKSAYVADWTYHDANGIPVLIVVRMNNVHGKTYRPLSKDEKGWFIGKHRGPYPLYNLPRIIRSFDETIFVVEGEKAADALIRLGLLATTSSGGVNGLHTTDWSPMKSRKIIIWPDNDKAGLSYAEEIKSMFPKATIFQPDGLPPKGDAYDWVQSGGTIDQLRKAWKTRTRSP